METEPAIEPLALALTRPSMMLGVRYEYFALNGMLTVIIFIATSRLWTFGLAIPIHVLGVYLCARDPYVFHILEVLLSKRRAIANAGFWRARSYAP
jgi:type IV secretion system protein VirB3